MSHFDYLLSVVSILIGLAMADLATSLHHLLRARRRVQWDWLPLAAASLVLLLILQFWWAFFRFGQADTWSHYGSFLVLAASLIAMFLLASATLPDSVPESGLVLSEYYQENQVYIWSLFGIFMALTIVVQAIAEGRHAQHAAFIKAIVPNVVLTLILISLATIKSRRYHAVVVPAVLVLLGLLWLRLRLA